MRITFFNGVFIESKSNFPFCLVTFSALPQKRRGDISFFLWPIAFNESHRMRRRNLFCASYEASLFSDKPSLTSCARIEPWNPDVSVSVTVFREKNEEICATDFPHLCAWISMAQTAELEAKIDVIAHCARKKNPYLE